VLLVFFYSAAIITAKASDKIILGEDQGQDKEGQGLTA
jgi:hypothetical protein